MGAGGMGEWGIVVPALFLRFKSSNLYACCWLSGTFRCIASVVDSHKLSICTTMGLNYLFTHLPIIGIPCKYVNSGCILQRSAERHGFIYTAPFSLAYPCKGSCNTARIRVWLQFKAKVTGNFSIDGDGLWTSL